MSQEFYNSTILETALVVDVNMKNWTVTVGTQHSDRILEDVPWATPYLHPEGDGVSYFPEVGAQCILCTPSDGETSPFVLAFIPIPKKSDHSSNRQKLRPGDLSFTTRDGNFVILRRGGVVQIGASPLAQRMYLPLQDLIRDIAQSYSLETFAGSMSWEVDTEPDDSAKTRVRLKIRDNAKDLTQYPVTVLIGDCPSDSFGAEKLKEVGGSQPIIEIEMNYPEKGRFSFALDREGVLSVYSNNKLSLRFEEDVEVKTARLRLVASESVYVEAGQKFELKTSEHLVAFDTSKETGASKIIEASTVELGPAGRRYNAVKWESLQDWLNAAKVVVVPTPAGLIGTFDPVSLAALVMLRSNSVKIGE